MVNTNTINENAKPLLKYTTWEFANFILRGSLGHTDIVYDFSTSERSLQDDIQAIPTPNPWPWYAATIIRPVESYSLYINRCTMDGGAAFVFDIPSFDMYDIGNENILEVITNEIIAGLNQFNKIYSKEPDTWYLTRAVMGGFYDK